MIRLDSRGARSLLRLLETTKRDRGPTPSEIEQALDANSDFDGYYAYWDSDYRGTLRRILESATDVSAMPPGFRKQMADSIEYARGNLEMLEERLERLEGYNWGGLTGSVAARLPQGTPLDARVILTIDGWNGAFAYQGKIAISVLQYGTGEDEDWLRQMVSHELHHLGFGHWSNKDLRRQKLLGAGDPSSVAVRQVENLLMEGLANHYFTSLDRLLDSPRTSIPQVVLDRVLHMRQEINGYMGKSEDLLEICFSQSAGYDECMARFNELYLDSGGVFPADHYIGECMVRTVDMAVGSDRLVEAVVDVSCFLSLYNEAAAIAGTYQLDPRLVEAFGALWRRDVDAAP